MNIIVKCPSCGHYCLAKKGREYVSELVTTESVTCSRCASPLRVEIRIVATVAKKESSD